MKNLRPYLPASLFLLALLLFCLWAGGYGAHQADHWQDQVHQADTLAQSGDWDGAETALQESYQDWSAHQSILHILCTHDIMNDAEAMYHRGLAFAEAQEPSEFHAEMADLQDQLHVLAEWGRFRLHNIL